MTTWHPSDPTAQEAVSIPRVRNMDQGKINNKPQSPSLPLPEESSGRHTPAGKGLHTPGTAGLTTAFSVTQGTLVLPVELPHRCWTVFRGINFNTHASTSKTISRESVGSSVPFSVALQPWGATQVRCLHGTCAPPHQNPSFHFFLNSKQFAALLK